VILDFGLDLFKNQRSKIKDQFKQMKCENLQFNLPLFSDEILSATEREQLDTHLAACPLCRAKLSEFQSLKNDLRFSPRPEIPQDVVFSVKNALAAELKRSKCEPVYIFSSNFREWLQFRLMPYSVGTIVSVFLTISLLMTLLSTKEATQRSVESAQMQSNRSVILMASNTRTDRAVYSNDYSALNLPVAIESPKFNPAGALMALSRSIVRGQMKDEEVVVVADVFGNGIARIAEVVEAPHDRRAMQDLERALSEDPGYAPFVSSTQDKRSDVVRVVLKIQRVDVLEKNSSPKK
jgi:hypothetical protein